MELLSELTRPPAGGTEAAPDGVARRLGIVLAGVLAVAAAAVAVAVALGPTTASSFLVVVAGGLVGFIAGLATALGLRVPCHAERVRTWAAERNRAVDDAYLAGEIRWRWRNAAEGAGIGQLVYTPSGATVSVPPVLRVQLRPSTRLTVRLRPGQLVGDVVAVERRLRELMGANRIRIARLAADMVTIELW
jgi:hypothetical protein